MAETGGVKGGNALKLTDWLGIDQLACEARKIIRTGRNQQSACQVECCVDAGDEQIGAEVVCTEAAIRKSAAKIGCKSVWKTLA